jgi:hypothetical protein
MALHEKTTCGRARLLVRHSTRASELEGRGGLRARIHPSPHVCALHLPRFRGPMRSHTPLRTEKWGVAVRGTPAAQGAAYCTWEAPTSVRRILLSLSRGPSRT